jgi:hypothetical protein
LKVLSPLTVSYCTSSSFLAELVKGSPSLPKRGGVMAKPFRSKASPPFGGLPHDTPRRGRWGENREAQVCQGFTSAVAAAARATSGAVGAGLARH